MNTKFDVAKLKQYISSAGCLGPEYNSSFFVLDDMTMPTGINGGRSLLVERLSIGHLGNEAQLARFVVDHLLAKNHNAIAFYLVDDETMRFASLNTSY